MSVPYYIGLRPATGAELGFVVKNWIRSYANSPWAGAMSRELQVGAIRGTIFDLLRRGAELQIAYLKSSPDKLLGFVCYERDFPWPVVHYVYVKERYRQCGIGRALVETAAEGSDKASVRYTHKTVLGQYLFPRDRYYRPRLARRPKQTRRGDHVPAVRDEPADPVRG